MVRGSIGLRSTNKQVVVHILYNALEGEGWSAICYMRYIREAGCLYGAAGLIKINIFVLYNTWTTSYNFIDSAQESGIAKQASSKNVFF